MTNIKNIISKHQNEGVLFDFPEQDREFISLKDLYNSNKHQAYQLQAIFINTKSKFGDAPVFYIDGYMVNIPQHQLEKAEEMKQDEEFVNAVNQGLIGFRPYEFENKSKQKGYSFELVDLSENENKQVDNSVGRAFGNAQDVQDDDVPF